MSPARGPGCFPEAKYLVTNQSLNQTRVSLGRQKVKRESKAKDGDCAAATDGEK